LNMEESLYSVLLKPGSGGNYYTFSEKPQTRTNWRLPYLLGSAEGVQDGDNGGNIDSSPER
jgi:hypothetical protein